MKTVYQLLVLTVLLITQTAQANNCESLLTEVISNKTNEKSLMALRDLENEYNQILTVVVSFEQHVGFIEVDKLLKRFKSENATVIFGYPGTLAYFDIERADLADFQALVQLGSVGWFHVSEIVKSSQ